MKSIMLQRALALSIMAGLVAPAFANDANVEVPAVTSEKIASLEPKIEITQAGKEVAKAEGYKAQAAAFFSKNFENAKTISIKTYNMSAEYAKANPKKATAIGVAAVAGTLGLGYGLYKLYSYMFPGQRPVQGCETEMQSKISAMGDEEAVRARAAHELMVKTANANDKKAVANTQPVEAPVAPAVVKRNVVFTESFKVANVSCKSNIAREIRNQLGTLTSADVVALQKFEQTFGADVKSAQAALAQLQQETGMNIKVSFSAAA